MHRSASEPACTASAVDVGSVVRTGPWSGNRDGFASAAGSNGKRCCDNNGRHEHMNIKRMRGRGHHQAPRHQHRNMPMNRNHVFDSNGPDVRLRGTSQQLFEKYLQLGRDATSAGDRVMAESYFQHAEHYFRILNAMQQAQGVQGQGAQGQPQQGGQNGNGHHRRGYEGEGIDPVDAAVEQAMNGHSADAAVPAGEGEQPKIQPVAD
jgi:hypothetical protein